MVEAVALVYLELLNAELLLWYFIENYAIFIKKLDVPKSKLNIRWCGKSLPNKPLCLKR
jgi:uncharacterized membrane protein YqhA